MKDAVWMKKVFSNLLPTKEAPGQTIKSMYNFYVELCRTNLKFREILRDKFSKIGIAKKPSTLSYRFF